MENRKRGRGKGHGRGWGRGWNKVPEVNDPSFDSCNLGSSPAHSEKSETSQPKSFAKIVDTSSGRVRRHGRGWGRGCNKAPEVSDLNFDSCNLASSPAHSEKSETSQLKSFVKTVDTSSGRGRIQSDGEFSHGAIRKAEFKKNEPDRHCQQDYNAQICQDPSEEGNDMGGTKYSVNFVIKQQPNKNTIRMGPPSACLQKTIACSEKKTDFAPFPGFGTAGRPIDLIANYFNLKCNLSHIYHYDIEITRVTKGNPKGQKKKTEEESEFTRVQQQQMAGVGKKMRQEVFAELVKMFSLEQFKPIYDGADNLFTKYILPIKGKTTYSVDIDVDGRKIKYLVTVKPVEKQDGSNIINMKPPLNSLNLSDITSEYMLALNAIMNHRNYNSLQVRVGRSFFYINQVEKISVGEGLEIWRGYNQSVHLTRKGPAVVLNLSAKLFHKAGPALNYIGDVLRRDMTRSFQKLKEYEILKIEMALFGVRVCVTHLPYRRKFYIQGLTKLPAQDYIISIDKKSMTVAQYFKEQYGALQYPHFPCFNMRTGSKNKQILIPIEKCEILEGQAKSSRETLNPRVASEMIKRTAIPPSERFRNIQDYASVAHKESGTQIQNFNLFMELHPKGVPGRVIDPPQLSYYGNKKILPNERGTWMVKGEFIKPPKIKSWIVINFVDQYPYKALESFAYSLKSTASSLGLHLGELINIVTIRGISTKKALNDEQVKNADLAIIVLSKHGDKHRYDEIKFIADYQLELVTQCILDEVVDRFDKQIATNICLKISSKLGGVNHQFAKSPKIFEKPVIIFGADVVHSTLTPSIASVVGSLDSYPSKYQVCCRIQENKKHEKKSQELILELKDMVVTILKAFYHHTKGKRPEKIIFFRDGVSEGQFKAVRDEEVSAIQIAVNEEIGYAVPITFVIVQKRHQTRFQPRNPKDGIGRGKNIPPGTTVDRDITYPNAFDYFLCSHEGIRGTSKPSRYTVLYDDNKFTADELHELTYHMCHMFVRCNRSVSIPAPVKYADLAAYRAKKYVDLYAPNKKYAKESSSSSSGDSASSLPEFVVDAINNMENCKNNMFFI